MSLDQRGGHAEKLDRILDRSGHHDRVGDLDRNRRFVHDLSELRSPLSLRAGRRRFAKRQGGCDEKAEDEVGSGHQAAYEGHVGLRAPVKPAGGSE
jgi:hypothetical protein